MAHIRKKGHPIARFFLFVYASLSHSSAPLLGEFYVAVIEFVICRTI